MLASGAFIQVQSSLRWFVDNFSTIADWRATLLRVASFRRAIIDTDVLHDIESRISFETGEPGKFGIEDLEIASPAGATMLAEKKVEITAGERVLIVGESGTGKTLLFRTLAGLWPWGAGRVTHPRDEELLYMPRTPYLPPGTLREVLAYPAATEKFKPADYANALTRLKLDRFAPMLDLPPRWARELIDEVLDSLDDDTRRDMLDLFVKDLPHTAVIHIGRADAHDQLFSRVLHLVKDPTLRRLETPVAQPP
jgi:vitamin B12/bleomycin/antimicrobial peptide transport system ATP-binding/permease protein